MRCVFVSFLLAVMSLGLGQTTPPACDTDEHRQFDFWLGDWRVEDPAGVFQGTNLIVEQLDGCVIQENWTGAGGTRGHSYNLYYAAKGIWHQTWVDSSGSLLQLDGSFTDGKMVLEGTTPSSQNPDAMVFHRISWNVVDNNPDHVRQLWEVSTDEGVTWRAIFDGQYYRQ